MGRKKTTGSDVPALSKEERKAKAAAALAERYTSATAAGFTGTEAEFAKRDRFVRLAPKRVTNAIKAIRNVGRLGNKGSYTFTADEAGKVMTALQNELERMIDAFAKDRKETTHFSL